MENDSIKKKPEQCTHDDLFDLTEDILRCLEDGDDEEYSTNQHMVGMRHHFRGFIVKTWKGVNFSDTTYRKLNKIVMRHCVMCYKKCWDHRNESYHDETIQRQRVMKWHCKVKEQIETKEPLQVRLFIIRNKIQVEQCRTETIVQWMHNAMKMIKKAKNNQKMTLGDTLGLRRFDTFECA